MTEWPPRDQRGARRGVADPSLNMMAVCSVSLMLFMQFAVAIAADARGGGGAPSRTPPPMPVPMISNVRPHRIAIAQLRAPGVPPPTLTLSGVNFTAPPLDGMDARCEFEFFPYIGWISGVRFGPKNFSAAKIMNDTTAMCAHMHEYHVHGGRPLGGPFRVRLNWGANASAPVAGTGFNGKHENFPMVSMYAPFSAALGRQPYALGERDATVLFRFVPRDPSVQAAAAARGGRLRVTARLDAGTRSWPLPLRCGGGESASRADGGCLVAVPPPVAAAAEDAVGDAVANGGLIRGARDPDTSVTVALPFALAGLPPSVTGVVRVSVAGLPSPQNVTFVRVPPKPAGPTNNAVVLDYSRGTLMLADGSPLLLSGWRHHCCGNITLELDVDTGLLGGGLLAGGFNFATVEGGHEAALDALQSVGMYGLYSPDLNFMKERKENTTAAWTAFLDGIALVKDHPALLAYYPDGLDDCCDKYNTTQVRAIYAEFKRADPYHPVIPPTIRTQDSGFALPASVNPGEGMADLAGVENYPGVSLPSSIGATERPGLSTNAYPLGFEPGCGMGEAMGATRGDDTGLGGFAQSAAETSLLNWFQTLSGAPHQFWFDFSLDTLPSVVHGAARAGKRAMELLPSLASSSELSVDFVNATALLGGELHVTAAGSVTGPATQHLPVFARAWREPAAIGGCIHVVAAPTRAAPVVATLRLRNPLFAQGGDGAPVPVETEFDVGDTAEVLFEQGRTIALTPAPSLLPERRAVLLTDVFEPYKTRFYRLNCSNSTEGGHHHGNLVVNPSVETTYDVGRPAAWAFASTEALGYDRRASLVAVTSDAFDGRHALRVAMGPAGAATMAVAVPGPPAPLSSSAKNTNATTANFTVMARTTAPGAGRVVLSVGAFAKDGVNGSAPVYVAEFARCVLAAAWAPCSAVVPVGDDGAGGGAPGSDGALVLRLPEGGTAFLDAASFLYNE